MCIRDSPPACRRAPTGMGATQGRADRSLSSRTCRHDARCVPDRRSGQHTDHQHSKDSPAGRPCLQ
eukprot:7112032-Pyramimonas_sp.AAC.1